MPNIIKSWKDFASVEEWITNTQVAESRVTRSVADKFNTSLLNSLPESPKQGTNLNALSYKILFTPPLDYKGEFGFDGYKDELGKLLTHYYQNDQYVAVTAETDALMNVYETIPLVDGTEHVIPYVSALKNTTISLSLVMQETTPTESISPLEVIRVEKRDWMTITCSKTPIKEQLIDSKTYWELNYRSLNVSGANGNTIQIKILSTLSKTERVLFFDGQNQIVGALNFVANEVYKLPIKIVGLAKKYMSEATVESQNNAQAKAQQYLNEIANIRTGIDTFISMLDLKLADYLNNNSLNQASIQCEFERDANDNIVVHPLYFPEIEWETQGYFESTSNWLRDSSTEKKDILDKTYETCIANGLISNDYRGIVLVISALRGDDEGGKADLYSENGKIAMIFFSNIQNWATYAHEIAHVLGLSHSFYRDENTLLNSYMNLIKNEIGFQNLNQNYIDKQQRALDNNLLTEEGRGDLEKAKQAQIASIAKLNRFRFSKSIYEINKFRFEKAKTTNIMDYSKQKYTFFHYQWKIMQNEIIQYYGYKE
jgi:hypothetical protein